MESRPGKLVGRQVGLLAEGHEAPYPCSPVFDVSRTVAEVTLESQSTAGVAAAEDAADAVVGAGVAAVADLVGTGVLHDVAAVAAVAAAAAAVVVAAAAAAAAAVEVEVDSEAAAVVKADAVVAGNWGIAVGAEPKKRVSRNCCTFDCVPPWSNPCLRTR